MTSICPLAFPAASRFTANANVRSVPLIVMCPEPVADAVIRPWAVASGPAARTATSVAATNAGCFDVAVSFHKKERTVVTPSRRRNLDDGRTTRVVAGGVVVGHRERGAAVDAELLEDPREMDLHRRLADRQPIGELLVARAGDGEPQYFALALAEAPPQQVLRRAPPPREADDMVDARVDPPPPRPDPAVAHDVDRA